MKKFLLAVSVLISVALLATPLMAKKPPKDDAPPAEEAPKDEPGIEGIICHVTDTDAQTGKVMPLPNDKQRQKHVDHGDCEVFEILSDDPVIAARPCQCTPAPAPEE